MQHYRSLDNAAKSSELERVCVKDEPECDLRETLEPDSANIRVKIEPVIDSPFMVSVEVTCLKEESIIEEPVVSDGDTDTKDNIFITAPDLNGHGRQLEVCVTKKCCPSPTLNEKNIAEEASQECKISNKIFNSKSDLTRHMLFHDKDKTDLKTKANDTREQETFICKTCGQDLPSLTIYLKHRHKHLLEKPYMCEICEKKFNSKFLLSNHERIHTGEKPYSCNICSKKFAEQVNLTRHKRIHTGDKPHNCDLCHKSFSLKHNLTLHIRSHTKEKPYECAICKKRFPHRSDLARHKKIHTGEKPFSCDTCYRKFARKDHLIHHLRVHNNEKPHSCDICDKKYVKISDCKKHLKVHMTNRKDFTCHTCKETFTHKLLLINHLHCHSDKYLSM